jgi:predicted nucleotidyltransferase
MDARLATTRVTPELLAYIVQKIVRAVNPQKIVLYGSHARGDAREDSDLDLFIVYDGARPISKVRRAVDVLLWGRDFSLDLMVRTPEQVRMNLADRNPFYTHHIFGDGRVLYERAA